MNWFLALGLMAVSALSSAGERSRSAEAALSQVSGDYVRTVKPIFARKCFDCHSRFTHFPWYASIPGVGRLIRKDVRDARADLDMSEDFPFLGKGTPTDYLEVVRDVVTDGSMPPWRYRVAHPGSKLKPDEVEAVLAWVRSGLAVLPP